MSELTNRVVPLSDVFGDAGKTFAEAVACQSNHVHNVAQAEALLMARAPVRDQRVAQVRQIVERIDTNTSIMKLDDLVRPFAVSVRTLQRLFRRYAGVSPKWVIQRYRLHEAIEAIESGRAVDWTSLALDLGYFDQAHFIRDFKTIVGQSPNRYARLL